MSPTVRAFLRDFLTGLDGPVASVAAQKRTAAVILFVGLPFVLAPTGLAHWNATETGWAPEVALWVARTWFALTGILAVASLAVLALPASRAREMRALTALCAVCILGTNEASMVGAGTFTTSGVVWSVAVVAGYRAFLDYGLGLLAVFTALGLLVAGTTIESLGWIPLAPSSPFPIVHPMYSDRTLGLAAMTSSSLAVVLTFGMVNYGANQSLELHRYITESVLRRYLPPALVARASRGELELDATPERREVTVLFVDLVGFTSLSDRIGASAVGEVLNGYLAAMAELAHDHGATVDKFVGDAVMMVFGAPEPMSPEEQARRCVDLAQALLDRVAVLGGPEPLSLRAGINTGEAVVGNFGSAVRSNYTVIGPSVNVASRLESASRPGRILLGPRTAELLGDRALLEPHGPLNLKGVVEPVQAYFWQGWAGDEFRRARAASPT